MNILFVIENLSYGGGERSFEQIIRKIDKERFKLFVACNPGGDFVGRIKGYAKVFSLDFSNRFNVKNIFYLKKLIKENKIDIVHSQSARADFFARIAGWLSGVPVISTVAMPVEGFDVNILKKFFYIIFDRISERFVEKFAVPTNYLKKRLQKYHFVKPEKIEIIDNGVELDIFVRDNESVEKIRKEFNCEKGTILIGCIGRLVWQKGFEYFLDAIKILEESISSEEKEKLRYVVVGEGELREKLVKKAKNLGLEKRVFFAGYRTDVNKVLCSLDIFVLPSLREGQPIVLLEAMALARPIVATNISAVTETVISGKTAVVVKVKDADSLAKGMLELIRDREKAEQMGIEARRLVGERFDFSKIVKKYEEMYLRVYKKWFGQ